MVGKGSLVSPCDGAGLPDRATLGSRKDGPHCDEGHQAEKAAREKVHNGPCVVPYDWPPEMKPFPFRHTREKDRKEGYRKDWEIKQGKFYSKK